MARRFLDLQFRVFFSLQLGIEAQSVTTSRRCQITLASWEPLKEIASRVERFAFDRSPDRRRPLLQPREHRTIEELADLAKTWRKMAPVYVVSWCTSRANKDQSLRSSEPPWTWVLHLQEEVHTQRLDGGWLRRQPWPRPTQTGGSTP